ncbi:MAG TPA: hypothetical protein VN641_01040 [Urbifossiella sp.]|jgi:hypothetical protein|nr:hypothetical protein [Urbifossiella sp.]
MSLASRIRLIMGGAGFQPVSSAPHRCRLVVDAACVCLLLLGSHAAYRASTGHVQNCDSVYSLIVGERLLATGSMNLADSFQNGLPPAAAAKRKVARLREINA